jgi:hypothetical protein
VSYRARFRLARWLSAAADVWLPDGIGPSPSARIDGATAPLVPAGEADGGRVFRLTLPDVPAGRAVVLDLRYTRPGARPAVGETVYHPPRVLSAAYSGPVRWLVTEPPGSAPLLLGGRARAELRWRWRGPLLAPSAAPRAELERWFTSGGEPDPAAASAEGEPLTARQLAPEPLRVARAPWAALAIACSSAAFLIVVGLARLRAGASGAAVALVGGAVAVGAVLYPQPAAQAVAAAQPGLAAAAVALAAQAAVRWRVRRRVRYLPGFTRTPPDTATASVPLPAPSARSRPGSTGQPAPAGSGT